jgi:UTP--glucose-1-phosphate uridylyltransferase
MIEVAVIPAAGRGTRMRPATRVVPKALITVVDRPAIQYAVEEAARAGAREVILVVDLDAGGLIRQHFAIEGPLPGLEHVRIRLAVQEEPLGLGHAVWVTEEMVAGRPFMCLLADNIVRPGQEVLAPMSQLALEQEVSVVCLRQLSDDFLSRYGVVVAEGDDPIFVRGAIEKPGIERAPSRLGLIGRYVFTPQVFAALAETRPGHGGEIQLTDAIDLLGRNGQCVGWVADEEFLDVGNPSGLLEASVVLGESLYGHGAPSLEP